MKTPPSPLTHLVLALALWFGSPSYATPQPDPDHADDFALPNPPTRDEQHNVLVMPNAPIYLHLDAPTTPADLTIGKAPAAIEHHLRRHPYFHLASPNPVLGRLLQEPGVAERLLSADRERREGIQSFYRFDFETATKRLELSRQLYDTSHGSLLAAERLAEVHQFLAFCKLEQQILGLVPPGQEAPMAAMIDEHFEALVRLDPSRQIDDRRHTPEQVSRYRQARWRFLQNPASLLADDLQQARALATRFKDSLHFIVFARVLQSANGDLTLHVRVFHTRADIVVFEEHIVLPSDTEALRERADALMSRFSSYTPALPPPPVVVPDEYGRLYVDLAFSYLQFFERPTRELFHNLGASFGASYMLTNHFSFVARAHFSISGRDVKGDLLSTFNSIRGFVGVGLSLEAPKLWSRFYFQTGFEAAALSDFTATRDIRCKVYGVDDPIGECPAGEVKTYSLDTLGGLSSTVGLNFGVDPTFLVVQVSSAFYFMPFNDVSVINIPLSVEVGAQYRFF